MALVLSGDSPSLSGTYQGGAITSGTAVASTSGTSITFSSIPSWVKRITVMFQGVSTSGTSNIQVQIGSGSVDTSGYTGSAWSANTTNALMSTGFLITASTSGAYVFNGVITLSLLGSNIWAASGTVGLSNTASGNMMGGVKTALSGALDRVVVTTVNGTDTFDAGSINILYE